MIALYIVILIVFAHSVYDALYKRKNYEQVFYLTLVSVSAGLMPLLYYSPLLYIIIYGVAYGIFVHDTPFGKFIISKNCDNWSTDAKCVLHGIISGVRYAIVSFVASAIFCNNFVENIEQKLFKLLISNMELESYGL